MNKKDNLFGNYLRNQRTQHGLSLTDVAENLRISASYVQHLEVGNRLPSSDVLQTIADFFKVEFAYINELVAKQKIIRKQQKQNNDPELSQNENLPDEVRKFNQSLLKLSPSILPELLMEFTDRLNKFMENTIANYSISELRSKLNQYNSDDNNAFSLEGLVSLPEKQKIYFCITKVDHVLSLTLLQQDRKFIDTFENWLGPNSFSYIKNVTVPQLVELQKGVIFHWFDPDHPLSLQAKYIFSLDVDLENVLFSSTQLSWYIFQLEHDSKEESTD